MPILVKRKRRRERGKSSSRACDSGRVEPAVHTLHCSGIGFRKGRCVLNLELSWKNKVLRAVNVLSSLLSQNSTILSIIQLHPLHRCLTRRQPSTKSPHNPYTVPPRNTRDEFAQTTHSLHLCEGHEQSAHAPADAILCRLKGCPRSGRCPCVRNGLHEYVSSQDPYPPFETPVIDLNLELLALGVGEV